MRSRQNDYVAALADYDRALELSASRNAAERADLLSRRGYIRLLMTEHARAVVDLTAAIALKSDLVDAYLTRAAAYRALENYTAEVADYDQALAYRPTDAMTFFRRASAKVYLHDFTGALLEYDKAVELKPADSFFLTCRGNARYGMGNYRGAVADFDAAISNSSDKSQADAHSYFFRFIASKKLGRDHDSTALAAIVDSWSDAWKKHVGDFLIGRMEERVFLIHAEAEQGTPAAQIDRRCQAFYYVGAMHALSGNRQLAEAFFERCVAAKKFEIGERWFAEMELRESRRQGGATIESAGPPR